MAFTHPLRQRWRDGEAAVNLWSVIADPWVLELLAGCGYDSLTIDMQHGLADFPDLVAILQAVGGRVPVLVRTSWNEPAQIMRALDAGAAGIICPLINNPDEAALFVGACRYPPAGYRSFGPVRAGGVDPLGYVAAGAAPVLAIAMIETAAGLANVDTIAATPGLDALYIGPADLSLSLGLEDVANFANPRLQAALEQVLAAAAQHGIIAGCHASNPRDAAMLRAKGFRLVTPAQDSALLVAAAKAARTAVDQ